MGWASRSDDARDYAEEHGMDYETAYDLLHAHEYPSEPDEADIILGLVEDDD